MCSWIEVDRSAAVFRRDADLDARNGCHLRIQTLHPGVMQRLTTSGPASSQRERSRLLPIANSEKERNPLPLANSERERDYPSTLAGVRIRDLAEPAKRILPVLIKRKSPHPQLHKTVQFLYAKGSEPFEPWKGECDASSPARWSSYAHSTTQSTSIERRPRRRRVYQPMGSSRPCRAKRNLPGPSPRVQIIVLAAYYWSPAAPKTAKTSRVANCSCEWAVALLLRASKRIERGREAEPGELQLPTQANRSPAPT
jgi:hypothetical protein